MGLWNSPCSKLSNCECPTRSKYRLEPGCQTSTERSESSLCSFSRGCAVLVPIPWTCNFLLVPGVAGVPTRRAGSHRNAGMVCTCRSLASSEQLDKVAQDVELHAPKTPGNIQQLYLPRDFRGAFCGLADGGSQSFAHGRGSCGLQSVPNKRKKLGGVGAWLMQAAPASRLSRSCPLQ